MQNYIKKACLNENLNKEDLDYINEPFNLADLLYIKKMEEKNIIIKNKKL